MNALYMLSLLKAVGMAAVVTTPSGHPAIATYDRPNGSQIELILFSNVHLETRLKACLEDAIDYIGLA